MVNTAKRISLMMVVGILSVLMVGLMLGGWERVSAAPPTTTGSVTVTNTSSQPVPVSPVGTTNVSGSVSVDNWPTSPLPVAQQGTVNVAGTVGLASGTTVKLDSTSPLPVSGTVGLADRTFSLDPAGNTVKLDSNLVKLDPNGNTVKFNADATLNVAGKVALSDNTVKLDPSASTVGLSAGANTVKLDPAANTVKFDTTSPMPVSGTVGLSDNTVRLDPEGNTVKFEPSGTMPVSGEVALSDNTVKLDPDNNTVKIDAAGPMPVSGTVGFSPDANTVKIDSAYTTNNPVKVWGIISLDSISNNKVQATNAVDPQSHEKVPLLVQIAGGSSAQQPVQFKHHLPVNAGNNWTDTYTVPAGKILKIEHVSVFAQTSSEYPQANVETTVGGVTMQHVLPRLELEYQDGTVYSTDMYRVSAPVAYYADGGTSVRSVVRSHNGGGFGTGGIDLMFSGYLMDQ